MKRIKLAQIKINKSVQPRLEIKTDVIDEYAEDMKTGTKFPPLAVVETKDNNFILWDGFHRYYAAKKAKKTDLDIEITKGEVRDAILLSLGANAQHGMRRSHKDKHRAVITMLKDEEWSQWSQSKIAEITNTSPAFVSTIVRELSIPRPHTVKTKKTTQDGEQVELKSSPISKTQKERERKKNDKQSQTHTALSDEEINKITIEYPALRGENKEKESLTASFSSNELTGYSQMFFGGCPTDQRLLFLKALKLLDEALHYVAPLDIPEVSGRARYLQEQVQEIMCLPWANIGLGVVESVGKTITSIKKWVELNEPLGIKKPTVSTKKLASEDGGVLPEAYECLALWEELIGLPKKRRPKATYAKVFESLHLKRNHSWDEIKELIQGTKTCWIDRGIIILSPEALLKETKSGDPRDEIILKQYRTFLVHPEKNNPPPKCPICNTTMVHGRFKKDNKAWEGYLCKAHPKESVPIGETYVPKKELVNIKVT